MKTQLPENYKKEVSAVLKNIAQGLGRSVVQELQPELNVFNQNSENLNKTLIQFQQNHLAFSETVQKELLSDLSILKKDLRDNSSFMELHSRIGDFEKRIIDTTNGLRDNLHNSLQEEFGNLTSLVKKQELTTILNNKMDHINRTQESLNNNLRDEFRTITALVKSQDLTTILNNKLLKIQEEQEMLYLEVNESKKFLNESIASEFQNVSKRLEALESNKTLETQLQANQAQLKKVTLLSIVAIAMLLLSTAFMVYKLY